jgi:hypothetical protein
MRKAILAIWASLYLMLAVGFSVDWHYCMGELSEIRFHDDASEICGRCGMQEKKGGCCENETKFYKYQHAYKAVKDQLEFLPIVAVLPELPSFNLPAFSTWTTANAPVLFPPEPPPPTLSLHKRIRVYRI